MSRKVVSGPCAWPRGVPGGRSTAPGLGRMKARGRTRSHEPLPIAVHHQPLSEGEPAEGPPVRESHACKTWTISTTGRSRDRVTDSPLGSRWQETHVLCVDWLPRHRLVRRHQAARVRHPQALTDHPCRKGQWPRFQNTLCVRSSGRTKRDSGEPDPTWVAEQVALRAVLIGPIRRQPSPALQTTHMLGEVLESGH